LSSEDKPSNGVRQLAGLVRHVVGICHGQVGKEANKDTTCVRVLLFDALVQVLDTAE